MSLITHSKKPHLRTVHWISLWPAKALVFWIDQNWMYRAVKWKKTQERNEKKIEKIKRKRSRKEKRSNYGRARTQRLDNEKERKRDWKRERVRVEVEKETGEKTKWILIFKKDILNRKSHHCLYLDCQISPNTFEIWGHEWMEIDSKSSVK
jgi:hypothetical protein